MKSLNPHHRLNLELMTFPLDSKGRLELEGPEIQWGGQMNTFLIQCRIWITASYSGIPIRHCVLMQIGGCQCAPRMIRSCHPPLCFWYPAVFVSAFSWPLSPKTIPWKTEYFFKKKNGFRGKLYRLDAYNILTGQPNDWCSDMEGTWEDLWCCAFAYIHPSAGWQLRAVVSKTLALSKSGGAWSSLRSRSLEEEPKKICLTLI